MTRIGENHFDGIAEFVLLLRFLPLFYYFKFSLNLRPQSYASFRKYLSETPQVIFDSGTA